MATAPHDLQFDRRTGLLGRRHEDVARPTPVARAAPATTVVRAPSTAGIQVSWGGIWGGVLAAIGIMLLLGALGMAVGITAVDPQSTDGATMGMAAGAWVGVSMLIALFVGGLVSTRAGATYDGATAFWEGGLVWIVSLLLMAYLATSGVTSLASGAMNLMGSSAQKNPQVQAAAQDPGNAADTLQSKLADATSNGQAMVRKAQEVKPVATKAAWLTFGGLVVSLLASVLGALAGRRKGARITH